MLRVLSGDPAAISSDEDRVAFAPNDWDIWVLVSDEDAAMDASAQLCKYFRVLSDSIRQDKTLRKKRIYTIANDANCKVSLTLGDPPYPARSTGIAVGDRKRSLIDVQVLNLGKLCSPDRFWRAYMMPNAPCLNLEGCIVSLELIKSKRKNKSYNIDDIRRSVFDTYMARRMEPKKVASFYRSLAQSFAYVFEDTDFAKENEGTIGRLLLRSLKVSGSTDVDDCEARLIEALRPSLNATVEAIEEKLNERDIGQIFITGGDAMRRFDSAIKVSKDIDTKIYVRPGRHVHDALEVATQLCAKAVTMMIEKRGQLLPKNVERVINGVPVGFMYSNKDADDLQFRLRYIPAEKNGRPRLISIDYRMQLRVGNTTIEHNIPILDVVIQRSSSKEAPLAEGSRPPIAALDWLVDDIKETWGSSSRAQQRVWAGKREKNRARLDSLQNLLDAGREPRHGSLGSVDADFLKYVRDQDSAPAIPDYLDLFDWAERRKDYLGPEKRSQKQKVPFSRRTLDEWRQEMLSHT